MSPQPTPADATSDREIVIAREFSAPRELVWDAMTNPAHVVNWWGPRGFRTQIDTMEVRPGGVWKHTMIGPDGTRYPNKSIFREIVRPERIVYTHAGGREEEGQGANFTATWTFDALPENRTRVTIRMVFATPEARERVVRDYGAIEGGRQTLERLSEHVAAQRTKPFVLTREFHEPRSQVWRAWTELDQLMRWFGPKGFTMPHATLDLRPGGLFHYQLKAPDGAELWGRFLFREIVPETKLVWINSFSDPAGGITTHPFSREPWPRELLTVVTFADQTNRTTVTISWLPVDATDIEIAVFTANHASMNNGWSGTMEQLTAHLTATAR